MKHAQCSGLGFIYLFVPSTTCLYSGFYYRYCWAAPLAIRSFTIFVKPEQLAQMSEFHFFLEFVSSKLTSAAFFFRHFSTYSISFFLTAASMRSFSICLFLPVIYSSDSGSSSSKLSIGASSYLGPSIIILSYKLFIIDIRLFLILTRYRK